MPNRDNALVLGFDADDTLWHSEDGFEATHTAFVHALQDVVPGLSDLQIRDTLDAVERANMVLLGYGAKAYTISLVESATELVGGAITAQLVRHIIGLGKRLLERPVELLDDVAETIGLLARRHHLVLITKGDLLHQERKIAESGLAHHFGAVEVVSEKHSETYANVLRRHRIDVSRFVMIGNSVRSDILPVLALGAHAVHIPYEFTWSHEVVDHGGTVTELASISELPSHLAELARQAKSTTPAR